MPRVPDNRKLTSSSSRYRYQVSQKPFHGTGATEHVKEPHERFSDTNNLMHHITTRVIRNG
jgi:hypothetical protein